MREAVRNKEGDSGKSRCGDARDQGPKLEGCHTKEEGEGRTWGIGNQGTTPPWTIGGRCVGVVADDGGWVQRDFL